MKSPIYKKWWFWVIIVVVVVGILAAVFGGEKSNNGESDPTQSQSQTTEPIQANPDDSKQKLDIRILSSKMGKDYSGKNVLLVEYEFTNNSDTAGAFSVLCSNKAFQNGVECSSITVVEGVDAQRSLNSVQPGATYTVTVPYLLSDTTTPVEIKVTDWIFQTQVYLEQTVNLQ